MQRFIMFFSRNKKEKLDTAKLIPLVLKLGEYLKIGYSHLTELKANGKELDPDTLALFVEIQMASWNPKMKNKDLLDNVTRKSASRFIAGIVCNLAKDEK